MGERFTDKRFTTLPQVTLKTLKKKQGTAAHDFRRTFAKLAHRGGSPIDQIQLSLRYNSLNTPEKYLGTEQNLSDAPCDHLGLRISG